MLAVAPPDQTPGLALTRELLRGMAAGGKTFGVLNTDCRRSERIPRSSSTSSSLRTAAALRWRMVAFTIVRRAFASGW